MLEERDDISYSDRFLLFNNRALACLSRVYFKILRVYRVGIASIALDTVDNTVFEGCIAIWNVSWYVLKSLVFEICSDMSLIGTRYD